MKRINNVPLGCMGNKKNELKILLPIIDEHITKKTIFVEPFCGSSIVSFNVFNNHNVKIHINDIEKNRIQFYENIIKEDERDKLYKFENDVTEKGQLYYDSIVKKKPQDFEGWILSKRIHSFRYGLFPTNKKIILKEISPNWVKFFEKATITNNDFTTTLKKY